MPEPHFDPLGPASPFFIVRDVPRSLAFYEKRLGFQIRAQIPAEDPFFGLVGRGHAQICLKAVSPEVGPLPNHKRHAWAPWDAFVHCADPGALAEEFQQRNTPMHALVDRPSPIGPLVDREDGLRGLEVSDPDGYVLFFGCPR